MCSVKFADRLVRSPFDWLALAAWLAFTACRTQSAPLADTQTLPPKEPSLPAAVVPAEYVDPEKVSDSRWETQRHPGPDGTELANGQAGPGFVAVDDRFVYWTNFEDDAVVKVEKDGSGAPKVIHRNDRGTNKFITVDRAA